MVHRLEEVPRSVDMLVGLVADKAGLVADRADLVDRVGLAADKLVEVGVAGLVAGKLVEVGIAGLVAGKLAGVGSLVDNLAVVAVGLSCSLLAPVACNPCYCSKEHNCWFHFVSFPRFSDANTSVQIHTMQLPQVVLQ